MDIPSIYDAIQIDNENQASLSQTNTPISPLDVEVHGYLFESNHNWFSDGKALISTISQSVLERA